MNFFYINFLRETFHVQKMCVEKNVFIVKVRPGYPSWPLWVKHEKIALTDPVKYHLTGLLIIPGHILSK